MKMKFLLPLLFLILLALSFILPFVFDVIFLISMPAMLIVNPLSEWFGGPVDTTYLVFLADLVIVFLVGSLWDIVAARIGG